MKETRTESRMMDNATLSKKLHNMIFSDNLCGLCFENGGENSIEHEVEATSDDCQPYISLGEMYTIVFREKPEVLASNMICKSCIEQLKQSYNFIQSSKSVTKLLHKYVDKLKSKINQLFVQLKKPDEGSMAIIALDYEEKNNNTSQLVKEENFVDKKHVIHLQEQIQRNSNAKCLDCDFTCRKNETLITHINKHHFDYQTYTCHYCSKKLYSKRSLDTHIIASHNQLFKCKFCGLDMDDKSIVEVHKDFCKERKKICKQQVEKRQQSLKESHDDKFLIKNSNKSENKTHVKSKIAQTIKIKSHLNGKNPDHITKNSTTLHPNELQREKCSDIKLNHQAKRHTQTKEGKKQKPHLPCELCDFKAWNSVLLECHMNRYHLKIKPYVCHICSKDFMGKHLLKRHIKLHTVDRSITCTSCGKKLANPSCLKSHLKLHTGEKNYPCDICGEKFRTSSIMKVHRVKKHRKGCCMSAMPQKFLFSSRVETTCG